MNPSTSTDPERAASGGDERLERMLGALVDAIRQWGILADVRAEGVRLRLRRTVSRFVGRLCFGAAMLLVVGAGVVLLVMGLVACSRALFAEHPGVGDLLSGAVLLTVALTWGTVRSVLSERAEVRRLEAKFADVEGGAGNGANR
ncbi:MAG: hypothetical protein ACKVXR_18555 [Planctomycetota bacterium]